MVCVYFRVGWTPTHRCCGMECARRFLIIMSNGVNPCEAPLIRGLINNQVMWVTWLWLWVSSFKLGSSWIGRCLSKAFVHIILGGPIWPIPSLGLPRFVSTIPCASLIPCGPSWTKVQVCDSNKCLSSCKKLEWQCSSPHSWALVIGLLACRESWSDQEVTITLSTKKFQA